MDTLLIQFQITQKNEKKKTDVPRPACYNGHLFITGLIVAIVGSMCYAVIIGLYLQFRYIK
jgi:hypothetical protein